ncbi:amino acid ABC transporter permease [Specibacter cremeus]|uniref:amino acid ABC transporter permease n=1 Tax=Specibacter cremeus TaxID=1629051 RepID=UPI000F7B1DF2|nr:amino acid ABC transporter permease [Specibacter cremeus]
MRTVSLAEREQTLSQAADRIAAKKHPGRILLAVAAACVVTWGALSMWFNPALDHETIYKYLTAESIRAGVMNTIVLAVISMVLGTVGGFIVAVMRLSSNPVLRAIGFSYVALVRSIPLLVLILFTGNLALFWSRVDIVNPFNGDIWHSWDMNDLVTPFIASILALSFNEAAYMGEIIRSGLRSVDQGQREAATALGLGPWHTMRKVILPQAMRVILPPTGSQFVTMIKMTSLVSVIAGGDLLTASQNIAATNLRTLELLVIASAWYLLVTGIATVGQTLLERRLERGQRKVSV